MNNAVVPASAQELTNASQVEELYAIKKHLDKFFRDPEVIERIEALNPENLKVIQSSRKKYDFSGCNHPVLSNLYDLQKEVTAKIKGIEKMLISLDQPLEIVVNGNYKLVEEKDIPATTTVSPPAETVSVIKYLK